MAAITGYVGPNGSGKSVSAVTDGMEWADRLDRDLYSALPVKWERRTSNLLLPRRVISRESKPIESFDQLRELRDVEILLDEVVSVLSSRETSVLPPKMVLALNTLRHKDVGLYWTAPSWMRADTLLREVTARIYVFRPVFQTYVEGQRWPRTRFSIRWTYDGTTDQGSRLPRHPSGFPKFIRIAGLAGFGHYAHQNPDIERIKGAGRYCDTCGGVRKKVIEPCECET